VLICYLDDSGKDPQSHITAIAGYIARDVDWQTFETGVEPIFAEYKVNLLHAKDLHGTDGDFSGWPSIKKQAFVAKLCQVRNSTVMMGMSMSAVKDTYRQRADESGRKRTVAPYTFCFNVILDWVLRDIRIGKAVHEAGVAFVIESGHENNSEVEQQFHSIREKHKLDGVLHSISFVPKESCRAIQLADLLAFYSRRDLAAAEAAGRKGKERYPRDLMLTIIAEGIPHRPFVASDFDQPEGPPTWRPPRKRGPWPTTALD
jgi:hypothetical protein